MNSESPYRNVRLAFTKVGVIILKEVLKALMSTVSLHQQFLTQAAHSKKNVSILYPIRNN